jgi:alkanesulfonate monooxygenase SsuD/methylene tetrahydromethanopterin reductase-like flavin-dependent oxidoreductase (luciferase family)
MAATVDALSGGRLDLGLGWGSVDAELRAFGIDARPAPERAARLRETLEILARMFAGEAFDYAGRHYRLEGAIGRPAPVQAYIPVHLGGAGPKLTMPLVREYADWWNCPSYAADRLADLTPLAGDARISVQHPIGLAGGDSDRAEVDAVAKRRFGSWGGVVTGTADEVAAALAADIEHGARGFVLQFHDFGATETLERFMADVAPAVRAAAGG